MVKTTSIDKSKDATKSTTGKKGAKSTSTSASSTQDPTPIRKENDGGESDKRREETVLSKRARKEAKKAAANAAASATADQPRMEETTKPVDSDKEEEDKASGGSYEPNDPETVVDINNRVLAFVMNNHNNNAWQTFGKYVTTQSQDIRNGTDTDYAVYDENAAAYFEWNNEFTSPSPRYRSALTGDKTGDDQPQSPTKSSRKALESLLGLVRTTNYDLKTRSSADHLCRVLMTQAHEVFTLSQRQQLWQMVGNRSMRSLLNANIMENTRPTSAVSKSLDNETRALYVPVVERRRVVQRR